MSDVDLWVARFPDLIGKTAVIGSDESDPGERLVAVARLLAANQVRLALVCPDRIALDAATAATEADVYAVLGNPSDPDLWRRVVPHVEQRLGPVDVAVAMGSPASRAALVAAVSPDMTSRRRGVVIAVGDPHRPNGAPKCRLVVGGEPDEVAAAVLLCASDTTTDAALTVQFG